MTSCNCKIFVACLLVVAASFTQSSSWGQGSAAHSPAVQPELQRRGEPAPLIKGGFIQQLRALPDEAVKTLREAENNQFRLPPRSENVRPAEAQAPAATANGQAGNFMLPPQPTGRLTLPPSHGSPWQERMQHNAAQARQANSNRQLERGAPSRVPETYREVQGRRYSSQIPAIEKIRFSDTVTEESNSDVGLGTSPEFGEQRSLPALTTQQVQRGLSFSDSPLLAGSNEGVESEEVSSNQEPRNQAFDALTTLPAGIEQGETQARERVDSQTLQQAPRVSRVPLPRSSAQTTMQLRESPTHNEPTHNDSVDSPAELALSLDQDFTPPDDSNDFESNTPARIAATPASVAPRLGTMRISNAQLQSSSTNSHLPQLPLIPGDSHMPSLPTLPALGSLDDVSSTSPLRGDDSESRATMLGSLEDETAGPLQSIPALPVPSPVATPEPPRAAPPSLHMPQLVTGGRVNDGLQESVQNPAGMRGQPATDQRLRMEAPRVAVVLNGPSDLPIGTPSNYQIVVRNEDTIDLQGLILRLDIPAGVQVQAAKPTHGEFEIEQAADGLTMLTWGFDHLAAGKTATAPMQLVASTAKNFAVAMEWTLMPIAGSSSVTVSAPRLELALEGPSEVTFGQPNVYRLHVRNPGTAAATAVQVRLSAESFGSSSAQIDAIAAGEEEVIEVELTFNERGAIKVAAEAQESTGVTSQTGIDVIVRQADLQAQLLASEVVYHGSPTECRVRLTNRGDADAQDLRATLQLPEGAALVSAPAGGSLTGRQLDWPVSRLVAGSSEEFLVQLKLTSDGDNDLLFNCRGSGNVAASASAVTLVQSITDLKLFVNDPIAPAPVGSEVVYELNLNNRGSKAATNVKVVAQFSDGIEPVRSEGQTARVVPGQILFDPLPRLGAGESIKLQVFATAATAGTHRFRVEVRSDESDVRLVQEESTQYLESVSRMAAPTSSTPLR